MMRIGTAAVLVALAGGFSGAEAQTAASAMRAAQVSRPVATDVSGQRRIRRPLTRLRVYPNYEGVYPRYNPGPNAVRDCNVAYVQEYRPSGTVIVPHMSCYWRRG